MSVLAVAAELWDRVAGMQPAPPVWVVAVSGAAALLVVLNPQAWHLARNAITIAHESRRRGRPLASDADQLARLTGVPGGVWVALFGLVAVAALVAGARLLVPVTMVHIPSLR
jgi:hypothetical protein